MLQERARMLVQTKVSMHVETVVIKETGEFIGDCGITIQNIDGEMLPEIGF